MLLSVFPRFMFVIQHCCESSEATPVSGGMLLPAPHIGLYGDFPPTSPCFLPLTSLGEKITTFKFKCQVQGHAYKTFPGMGQDMGWCWGRRFKVLVVSRGLMAALPAFQGWAVAEQPFCDIPLSQGRCAWRSECHSWASSLLFSLSSACSDSQPLPSSMGHHSSRVFTFLVPSIWQTSLCPYCSLSGSHCPVLAQSVTRQTGSRVGVPVTGS